MKKIRFDEIDVLRALGIIGVITIHVLTYNLTNIFYKNLWNYLQFFVVSFILCSGFVLSSIYHDSFTNISKTLSWYKKRLTRILIPFWIYLIVHYCLFILFPNYFNGLGLLKEIQYFVSSALLIGGTNYNFLPLLFVELTLLFPFFSIYFKKKKIILTYLFFSILITAIFTFFQFPYKYYREVMWIPWSLVLFFSIFIFLKTKDLENISKNKIYLFSGGLSFTVFIILYLFNLKNGNSLIFYDHKYPPDLYYLSFGISLTSFALSLARSKFWQNNIIKNIYGFLSKNSYQIFFIHYIVLDAVLVLSKKEIFFKGAIVQLMSIIIVTILIVLSINKLKAFSPK